MVRNIQTFLVEKTFFVSLEENKATDKKLNIPKKLPSVITISRQHGCYGAETAVELSKLLGQGWIVLHREILEAISSDSGVEKQYLTQFDEKTVPWIEEMFNGFYKENFSDVTFLSYLKKLTKSWATRGKVIIVGRGANFLLSEGFHIRLVASKEHRIKKLMMVNKLTKAQAEKEITLSDEHRKNYTKKLFNRDIDDPLAYDLTINVETLNFTEVARVIHSTAFISAIFQ